MVAEKCQDLPLIHSRYH